MPGRWPAALALLVLAGAPIAGAADEERDPFFVAELFPDAVVWGHLYDGWFSGPSGVFCDGDRREVVVADMGNSLIGIFDMRLVPLFAFSDPGRLMQPHSVVVDGRGRILVLDAERNRVKQYSYRGEFLKYLPLEGFDDKTEAQFTALALDTNGDLFLANSTTGEILVFDESGRRKRSFGTKGIGPGQFTTVQAIALDAEFVYASDMTSLGVQIFDKYGRFLRGWGRHEAGAANVSLPAGIAVDTKGRIFLVDTMRHEIKVYTPTGGLVGQFAGAGKQPGEVVFPVGLSTDRNGLLCVGDRGNDRVQVLSVREVLPEAKPKVPGRRRRTATAQPTASASPIPEGPPATAAPPTAEPPPTAAAPPTAAPPTTTQPTTAPPTATVPPATPSPTTAPPTTAPPAKEP